MTEFITEALRREHDRTSFRCGVEVLDRYLKQFVFQDVERRLAGCFVAIDADRKIAGFYTLAATSVAVDLLPQRTVKRLPRYPTVPGVLLGRMAVAVEHRGKGLGRALVADAAIRTDKLGIGAFALVVDPKDAAARQFYETLGFMPMIGETRRLFVPIATALAAGKKP